jgi:putative transposase
MRSFVHIHLHLIWSTKNREPLLLPEVRKQFFPILIEEASKLDSYVTCINGTEDHVHCLLNYHPITPLSDLVQQMKGGSSYWYNKSDFGDSFGWQNTYAAFSVSPSTRKSVESYIRNQEKHHHQRFTFEEEMRWLQKRTLNETME